MHSTQVLILTYSALSTKGLVKIFIKNLPHHPKPNFSSAMKTSKFICRKSTDKKSLNGSTEETVKRRTDELELWVTKRKKDWAFWNVLNYFLKSTYWDGVCLVLIYSFRLSVLFYRFCYNYTCNCRVGFCYCCLLGALMKMSSVSLKIDSELKLK